VAQLVGLVGVMAVKIYVVDGNLHINQVDLRPHISGYWTIEGSVTSQFEQHLRAILDLPLGSPALTYPYTVTGNVIGGEKTDMYRPYLHLMARTPELHFHQYKKEVVPGVEVGHVSACGSDLPYLIEEIEHARDYMSGVIDE
jgi:5-(carboxyamino)imidazole ribonucleotide synthase